MTPQDITKDFEGFVPTIYEDTVGKKTIGYGFNLEDKTVSKLIPPEVKLGKREITKEEADKIFNSLYSRAQNDAKKFIGMDNFGKLKPEARNILTDMAYNMGYNRLSAFQRLKKAMINGNMVTAAEELKNSKWFGQVGRRSRFHYETLLNLAKAGAQISFDDILSKGSIKKE